MEKDIDYERKIALMLKELKDRQDVMRYIYIIVKDIKSEVLNSVNPSKN